MHRTRKDRFKRREVDITAMLKAVLRSANEFVPSESGSILLDDPILKLGGIDGKLNFVACFGKGSAAIVGNAIPSNVGIVGETYTSGKPYISRDVSIDKHFYSAIDKKTKFISRSIICVPIEIEGARIGVIELINSKEKINYAHRDLAMLQIFAGYTSTLIQNTLDAKVFEKLSKLDNLTGLYNDRYFFECLEKEIGLSIKTNLDLSLIFFDLDHFKEVNDTYGHLAGSRVLKEVGVLMMEIFHSTAAVLTRYGGDEFIAILPETDFKEAKDYAEIVRARIESNVFIKDAPDFNEKPLNIKGVITASVGVASLKENVARSKNIKKMMTAFISQSDRAMYMAKESGKNRVCPAENRI